MAISYVLTLQCDVTSTTITQYSRDNKIYFTAITTTSGTDCDEATSTIFFVENPSHYIKSTAYSLLSNK